MHEKQFLSAVRQIVKDESKQAFKGEVSPNVMDEELEAGNNKFMSDLYAVVENKISKELRLIAEQQRYIIARLQRCKNKSI